MSLCIDIVIMANNKVLLLLFACLFLSSSSLLHPPPIFGNYPHANIDIKSAGKKVSLTMPPNRSSETF